MKVKYIIYLLLAGIAMSGCGKGGSPAPDITNSGNSGTNGGGNTGGSNSGGTTVDKSPIPEIYKGLAYLVSMTGATMSSNKTGLYPVNTFRFKTGGNIKIEFRNIPAGNMPYETDGYGTTYYPGNVFKIGGAEPALKDTVDHVFEKITDPTYKDAATGRQKIKYVFLFDATGAGEGGIGIVNSEPNKPINGAAIVAILNRSDYLAY